MKFTLEKHGDSYERAFGRAIHKAGFRNYGVFWRRHVVPVTFRRLNEWNMYLRPGVPVLLRKLATTHYWVFYHLARCAAWLASSDPPTPHGLYSFYSHLASASQPKQSMLFEFARAVDDVLEAYGGTPRWQAGLRANAAIVAAYDAIHDYRNYLQHNGGIPVIKGRMPLHPRRGFDLATIVDAKDGIEADPRFVDARNRATEDFQRSVRALNALWRPILHDLAHMKREAQYRKDQRTPRVDDQKLADDPDLLRTPVASSSSVVAVPGRQGRSTKCSTRWGLTSFPVVAPPRRDASARRKLPRRGYHGMLDSPGD